MLLVLKFLLAVAVPFFAKPSSSAQLPLARPPTAETGDKILDASFDDWLINLTTLWGMKGLAVAVVHHGSDGIWNIETKGYGIKNAAGDRVTDDVRILFNAPRPSCAVEQGLNGSVSFPDNFCCRVKLQALCSPSIRNSHREFQFISKVDNQNR